MTTTTRAALAAICWAVFLTCLAVICGVAAAIVRML
jgi:hypothetical protein